MQLTESDINTIREALQRCSPETIETAIRNRTTRDPKDVSKIVEGIIRRYVPPANISILDAASADTRLVEDLGLDSVTLLEVVLTAEEVFAIRVDNEELRGISTIQDMEEFIARKIGSNGA